jgi:hypothetical protein
MSITNFFYVFRILMKGITWARDSHGLFDYESRHLTKNNLKTTKQVTLRRVNNEVELAEFGVSDDA